MKLISCVLAALPLMAQQSSVRVLPDGSAEVRSGSNTAVFRPHFTIVYSEQNPRLGIKRSTEDPLLRKATSDIEGYTLPGWHKPGQTELTEHLFEAGEVIVADTAKATRSGDGVQWTFT